MTDYSKSRFIYAAAGAVALITAIVYLPSLQNGFVLFDDNVYVNENPHLLNIDSGFFSWAFFQLYFSNWHPLTWFSFAVDYAIWGLNPFGYHLTSVIFHALNTFLVVIVIVRLMQFAGKTGHENKVSFSARGILTIALLTGLLFGIHPLHVESVAWVSERKDVLYAFFFLLSVLMYVKYANERSIAATASGKSQAGIPFTSGLYYVTLLLFALSLMSKSMAVTLPIILLLLDWYPLKRFDRERAVDIVIEKVPFIMLSLLTGILAIIAQGKGGAVVSTEVIPLSVRVLVTFKALIAYLSKMIYPVGLSPLYPFPDTTNIFLIDPEYFVPIVFTVAITVACLLSIKRKRIFITILGYYVISLLPVIGIVKVGAHFIADRYTYLPSVGPFFLAAAASVILLDKAKTYYRYKTILMPVFVTAVILLIGSLSYSTGRQIYYWRDTGTLWRRVLIIEPTAILAHNNIGLYYVTQGLVKKGVAHYKEAIRLKPDYMSPYINLANTYAISGKLDSAINIYTDALEIEPDLPEAYVNMGVIYRKMGLYDEAEENFLKAIELNQNDTGAYFGLAHTYSLAGDSAKEEGAFRTILEIEPNHVGAHNNLAALNSAGGMFDEAIKHYLAVVRLSPDNAEAYNDLGIALGRSGSVKEALKYLKKAVELKPGFAVANFNLAYAYEMEGLGGKAEKHYIEAIKIQPDYQSPQYRLARLYHVAGRDTEAEALVSAVLSISPEHEEAGRLLREIRNR